MKPIQVYQDGRSRSEHLLKLSELLLDRRIRGIRGDWADNFKRLMHWRRKEVIDRVDGAGAILILREGCGVTAKHFRDEFLDELLRAATVSIVAAFDRYCHELVAAKIVAETNRGFRAATHPLRRFRVPILEVRKAIAHAKKPGSRPMNLIRESARAVLKEDTFQKPDAVARGLQMVGVSELWPACAAHMNCQPKEIISELSRIVDRRNRIVHEGDIQHRARGGHIKTHPIRPKQVAADIIWLSRLVDAIDSVANV